MRNNKLAFLALIFSLIFCAQLTVMGFAKFNSVETYGAAANFIDFPNHFTKIRINIPYLILNIIYLAWLLQNCWTDNKYSDFLVILKHAAIFLIIAFVSYPYSNDIYLYLQYGLMDLNGINPFINPAGNFTSNLSPFLHWSQTSTYGPISQLFFMIAAYTVPFSPVLGVYIFKVFCVFVHVINAYLIWRLLKSSYNRSQITMAYLINPFLLAEQVSGAHVDVFLSNALILLIGCMLRRHYVAVILMIWLGFLEKTLPIIWLPLALNFLVRKRRWKELAITAFLSLIIIIILSHTVLPTIQAWQSLLNPGVKGAVARSLHHLLKLLLNLLPNLTIQKQVILSVFTSITYLSFAVYYIWTLLQPYLKRRYSEANLILDIGWTTLILFLFATPWLMPWYPSVLLPITALITNSPLFVLTSLTFCISSSLIYGTGSGSSAISIITSITTIVPPIVMLLVGPKFLDRIIERVPLLNNKLSSKLS
jgi:alpha-1,6-mannosyltransferase